MAKLHIFLGTRRAADEWRKDHGIPVRDFVCAPPHQYTGSLRGFTGPYELITHGSWATASRAVREAVEIDLTVISATQPR